MLLDIHTLLVAVALATAFCTGARLFLWRMHLNIPGLNRWFLAGASTVITFILIFAYGKFQWWPFLSSAQLFSVIGLILSWDGFRRFMGKPPLSSFILAGIAAMGLILILVAHDQYSVGIKAVGNAVLVAVLSLLIARDLLFSSK